MVGRKPKSYFLGRLAIGQRQKALSWQLQSATNLARLWQDSGRTAQAREIFGRVYEHFTEGFTTRDLTDAKALIDILD